VSGVPVLGSSLWWMFFFFFLLLLLLLSSSSIGQVEGPRAPDLGLFNGDPPRLNELIKPCPERFCARARLSHIDAGQGREE
jgi:hypothetical protein